MTFAEQQCALGRIVSYKTDLWIGFSFPSQPSTKEQQVLAPNKMTTVSDADGLALRGEPSHVPHPRQSRAPARGAVATLQLPPASPRTPNFPTGRRCCPRVDFYTPLGETDLCSERVSCGGQRPVKLYMGETLYGSVVNWQMPITPPAPLKSGALSYPHSTSVGREQAGSQGAVTWGAEGAGLQRVGAHRGRGAQSM